MDTFKFSNDEHYDVWYMFGDRTQQKSSKSSSLTHDVVYVCKWLSITITVHAVIKCVEGGVGYKFDNLKKGMFANCETCTKKGATPWWLNFSSLERNIFLLNFSILIMSCTLKIHSVLVLFIENVLKVTSKNVIELHVFR